MQVIDRKNYQFPFIILFVLVGILFTVLTIVVFYYHELKLREQLDYDQAKLEFKIKKERFFINYERYKYVLHSITKQKTFLRYLDSADDEHSYEHAKELFNSVASSHPTVMQLRYLDRDGYEKIRFDRTSIRKEAFEVPKERLQDKSSRYYFINTKLAKENQFVISKLDLNVEQKKIEVPYKPVLRISLPIYHKKRFEGIVIVNVFMEELVQNITNSPSFFIYLLDQDNYILYSNNPDVSKWSRYVDEKRSTLEKKLLYKDVLLSENLETLSLGLEKKKDSNYEFFEL